MFAIAVVAAAAALVLTGAMAGLFYAYSISGMRGLDRIPADQAVSAMQSINRAILNPAFFVAFFGAPVASSAAGVLLLVAGPRPAAVLCFVAAAVYILGTLVPTRVVNVPLNQMLEAAGTPVDLTEAVGLWAAFSPRWTWWNTLRAVFSFVSLLLVGVAVLVWGWQR